MLSLDRRIIAKERLAALGQKQQTGSRQPAAANGRQLLLPLIDIDTDTENDAAKFPLP